MMVIYIRCHNKILLYTKNTFNDRGDKNNKRGGKGGALFPQMITAVPIPLEKKKERKLSLSGICQIYLDEPIPKHIKHRNLTFQKWGVCVHICIYHMPVGEKDMCETQKTGVAQGHSLFVGWGTEVKWQLLSTCLCAHIGSHGCPGFLITLPLLIGTIRGLTRKADFAEKFPIHTCQS